MMAMLKSLLWYRFLNEFFVYKVLPSKASAGHVRSTRLVDRMTGKILASKVEPAETFWRRFRGLMFRQNFCEGEALIFELKLRRQSIHTFFLRFSIDVIFSSSNFFVIEICQRLKPWQIHRPKVDASYIVELPAGTISCTNVKIGYKLALRKA
jgi:uncharacterized membrane protein (UPF0127 family)